MTNNGTMSSLNSSIAIFNSSDFAVTIVMSQETTMRMSQDDVWLHGILYSIRMCFLPIIALGTITNSFNFVILARKDMRFLSTSVYLFALAIADVGVMYLELFRVWFEYADLVSPEIYFNGAYCKIANYTNGVTRDFSNWLIACLTLERVMMVASPYKAKHLCTVRTAKRVTLSLLLTLCVPHIHCLIFSVPQKQNGGWVCWEDQSVQVGVIWASVVEFVIGYVVILVVFVLNIILVTMIYRNRLPCLTCASGMRVNNNRRLTRTLLVLAIVFLVCETPRMIMSFVCRFLTRTPMRRIILNLAFVLSGLNHASNFFIYILASPRFRLLLRRSFPVTLIAKHVTRKRQEQFTFHIQNCGEVLPLAINNSILPPATLHAPERSTTCVERVSPDIDQDSPKVTEFQPSASGTSSYSVKENNMKI